MICSYCKTHYVEGSVCPTCDPESVPKPDRYQWLPIILGVLLSFVVIVPAKGMTRRIDDVLMATIPDTIARLAFTFAVFYLATKDKPNRRKAFSYSFVLFMLLLSYLSSFWHAAPHRGY